jgi:hypothetical protein
MSLNRAVPTPASRRATSRAATRRAGVTRSRTMARTVVSCACGTVGSKACSVELDVTPICHALYLGLAGAAVGMGTWIKRRVAS